MGIATGWGAVKEGGPVSPTLQEVYVPILSNSECRESKYPSNRITNNMMCAGYKDGGKDSCQVSGDLRLASLTVLWNFRLILARARREKRYFARNISRLLHLYFEILGTRRGMIVS